MCAKFTGLNYHGFVSAFAVRLQAQGYRRQVLASATLPQRVTWPGGRGVDDLGGDGAEAAARKKTFAALARHVLNIERQKQIERPFCSHLRHA